MQICRSVDSSTVIHAAVIKNCGRLLFKNARTAQRQVDEEEEEEEEEAGGSAAHLEKWKTEDS